MIYACMGVVIFFPHHQMKSSKAPSNIGKRCVESFLDELVRRDTPGPGPTWSTFKTMIICDPYLYYHNDIPLHYSFKTISEICFNLFATTIVSKE